MKPYLILSSLCILFSYLVSAGFPSYQLIPSNPHPGDTLTIHFSPQSTDPKIKYLHFAFNLPFQYNSDNLKINRLIQTKWKKELQIVIPQNAALLYFYLEDRKGNPIKEDQIGSFIPISSPQGGPIRNAGFYQALIVRDIDPNQKEITLALQNEIQSHPDNFPAYYFLWKHQNYLTHPDSLPLVKQQLKELEDRFGMMPEYWEIRGRIGEIGRDYAEALSAYKQYVNLADSIDQKYLILSRVIFLDDNWSEYDSLIQNLFDQPAGPGRLQLFLSLLQNYQNGYPERIDALLQQALKSEDYSIRESAAYYRLLILFGQGQTESNEIPRLFATINYPHYLTTQQLNRLASLLAFYPDYQEQYLQVSEFSYRHHLGIAGHILVSDTLPSSQWNFMRISILENYAWALYLNGQITQSMEICRQLCQLSLLPDDILFYRIGVICYANDQLEQAMEYLGKSYLLNLQDDLLTMFAQIYRELNGEYSIFTSYLENLKSQTYPRVSFRDWVPECSLKENTKSILIIFSPLSALNLDDFKTLSSLSRSASSKLNLLSVIRSSYPLSGQHQSTFEHYGIPVCTLTPSAQSILSSISENSYLLLFDENDRLINRISFYRPDWQEVLDAFLHSDNLGE